MTRSAIDGPSSVILELCCFFLLLKKSRKIALYHSDPRSDSNSTGGLFVVVRIFEKTCYCLIIFIF